MDEGSNDRLSSALRAIPRGEFPGFVADCWSEIGWSVAVSREGSDRGDHENPGADEPWTDVVLERDESVQLIRTLDDGRDIGGNDVRRLIDDVRGRSELDGAAIVTTGELLDTAEETKGASELKLVGIDRLVRFVRDRQLLDLVFAYAPAEAGGTGALDATFDDAPGSGDAPGSDDPTRHPEDGEDGPGDAGKTPAEFTEIMWRVGPGSVVRMEGRKKTEHVRGIVENAYSEAITQEAMTTPPGDGFSLAPVDYLYRREEPAFLFREPKRGVRMENRGIAEDPSEDGATYHLITNRRIVSVVAREDDEFTLNVPLSEVESVENRPGLFDGELVLELTDDVCYLPVYHGMAADVVDSAAMYAERGPHQWRGADVARGSIDDPATFGDTVDAGGPD